ncbi:PREDICTED: RNA-binding protein 38-like [Ipomoea nil]|uniref:RNA-binding protein 38-like n=1 Tax=Ipomoea nil TaxID=35883 RepID=UPI0009018451|nr:PREDICTED: RNA-binding protein 38-like [Ipomoea nil]XP_019177396.1 PREDICTED: RNA-binding protein 38-like [Ipomoea nil]
MAAQHASTAPAGGGGPGPGQFGDTTLTKVFVGGLAWETQSESLRRYFEQFGEILEGVVITDKHTGRSKGYGFVTFRDPEAASRACANPNPVIDGRRANCNLASLGRPQPFLHGSFRSTLPHLGPQGFRGVYMGNPVYQLPVPYGYQPGVPYPAYRYPTYAPEYAYPQIYGLSGTNPLPVGHMSPQPGSPGYTMVRGYLMPGPHHMVQYHRPNVSGTITDGTTTAMQIPYHSGIVMPSLGQPQIAVRSHLPQFPQGSGSNQMSG